MVKSSFFHWHFRLVTLQLVLFAIDIARGQQLRNVSVDDPDPSIVYSPTGAWSLTATTSLDYPFGTGSSHSLSQYAGATATFTFTGVAVYYWSPLWPYTVNSFLALDGQPGVCVDLRDYTRSATGGHETVASSPRWKKEGLPDTRHTVVVSGCAGGQYNIVDAFSYTVLDNVTTSAVVTTQTVLTTATTPSSSSSSSSDSSLSSNSNSRSHITAIAVGCSVGGGFVLAALMSIFVLCLQRRARTPTSDSDLHINPRNDSVMSSFSSSPSPQMPTAQFYPGGGASHTPNNYLNGHLFANGHYDSSLPFNRWSPASPTSFYPNTLTPILEGSPLSDVSKERQLPEP